MSNSASSSSAAPPPSSTHNAVALDDTLANHPIHAFRADPANLPAMPAQVYASQSATQSASPAHIDSSANGYLPPQMATNAAPLLTSPSRSAPLPAMYTATSTSHSTPSASPNGRIRSQTAANAASPHSSGYMANGSNVGYHGSRSMRTSPQMRALPHHAHAAIPNLQGMGSSIMAPPSAPSSVYGGTANANGHSTMPATSPGYNQAQSGPQWERHTTELTNCIVAFLSPILPTEEEYRIKEATRRQLERLANRVSPGSKLLAFGSMANGFALRNSDMDLCCLIGKGPDGQPTTHHTASELVEILGQLIREETDFTVMPLPKARIPIIKINRSPTTDLPYEIACDIGFENRLALENTRLLLSYAMVDPTRLRTLVLFLKVWTKRRKLNSPYMGTLSSYGYTLLVLYFLTHVKKPAVLPNLQRLPPTRPMKPDEMELNGNNIYFYDDVATLRKEWSSQNTDNVGELLVDFFRYFSKEFSYARDVISLKSENGLIPKDGKTWNAELCIEDPFQAGYNVSRTVTKDGLYTIRGEFMRASRYLTNMRGQKISVLIAELCEEREDSLSRAPDGPGSMQRYPYNTHLGVGGANGAGFYGQANGGRHYRDTYGSHRRYDAPNMSGYGGSFAFEQMARGLSQGVAYPPTAAMLAPLSRTHGLSPKPQPRFGAGSTHAEGAAAFSSAQSDSGGYAPLDFSRASIGHASARTSPSFKHAVPTGFAAANGSGAQEAFAYGAEISFGAPAPASTRDDLGSTPRGKTSRSFSETLNRSKSLPRAAAANGHHTQPAGPSAGSTGLAPSSATPTSVSFDHAVLPAELESRMATLSVQQGPGARRLSNSSRASSSAQFDSSVSMQCSSASSPWSVGHAAFDAHHQQTDTHALVQEYLRRAAQLGTDITLPLDADKGSSHDVDGEGSVISEATLDELARLSELDDDEHDWREGVEDEGAQARRKHQHKVAAAAATAAATSGIARKDRENSAARR